MALVCKPFGDIITFTRASTGTYFNSAGTLTSAAINAPRLDYDPSTLAAQGLLIEEARTNSIRNNTMVGAVAGTPGTLPTNWPVIVTSGLSQQIIGTGTESGIAYIDIRFSGTTTSALFAGITSESFNNVSAAPNSIWTHSVYVKLVGGSLTGVSAVKLVMTNFSASSVGLNQFALATIVPTAAPLATQRYSQTSLSTTFSDVSTAFIKQVVQVEAPTATAIDITLRIGLPQLELGAFATSVIPTTTTALTRATDVASVNTLSPWFNATEGTLFAESSVNYTVPGTVFPAAVSLNDNTANNRFDIGYITSTVASLEVTAGGAAQAGLYPGNGSQTRKTAGVYAANDFAVSTNGSAPLTDTSGTVPTVTRLALGGRFVSGAIYLRRITYYPRRLSNAELQAITA